MEFVIKTEEGVRIAVDSWDDGGAWLGLQQKGSASYASLTRAEAQAMFDALAAILGAEVAA